MIKFGVFGTLVVWLTLTSVTSERLKDKIYVDVKSSSFCFRRTNGTHQFGCTSDLNGNVGVIHLITGVQDVDWIINKGQHEPYVAAFEPKAFSNENLVRLRDSKKISGAILLSSDDIATPEMYSSDDICPNSVSSLYQQDEQTCDSSNPWNPAGTRNNFENFDFPIFVTKDKNTTKFIREDCFKEFNQPQEGIKRDWPLCAMELNSHMYAAVDTRTCLRKSSIFNIINPKRFCDEMGDYNFYLFMKDRNGTESKRSQESVILVTTKLDTITMFDNFEFGADNPITNIVTILETARLLAQHDLPFEGDVTNILFAFMYGEAFDYIGSSRFVYDLKEQAFPEKIDPEKFDKGQQPTMDLNQIKFIMELGQTFNTKSNGKMFVHTDSQFEDKYGLGDKMLDLAQQNDIDMKRSGRANLPPSSIQSFLKEDRDIQAIFLSNFDHQYSNSFYHSIYDTGTGNLGYNYNNSETQDVVDHISKMAVVLSEFLFETSNPSERMPTFKANKTKINELLHCYLDTAKCKMFAAVSNARTPPFYTKQPDTPWPQYVGVDMKSQFHGILTRNLLAYFTGEKVNAIGNLTQDDCVTEDGQNFYEFIFLKGESVPPWWQEDQKSCNSTSECGYCYKTRSFRKQAISPAFVIDDYDMTDPKFAAWAESIWNTAGTARVFLKASPTLDKSYFSVGLVTFILSAVLIFWFERKAILIFEQPEPNGTSTTTTTSRASREGLERPVAV